MGSTSKVRNPIGRARQGKVLEENRFRVMPLIRGGCEYDCDFCEG
jgi:hypothetical protein